MKFALPVQGFGLTSPLRRIHYQYHPKHKLSHCNNRKPNRDEDVFSRHGVQPVIAFSGIDQGPLNNGNSKPEGQHDLGGEGAEGEHEDRVPRSFFATVLIGR